MPRGAAVIRYEGARDVVWRIKYVDASGRQVMETVGAARDGVTRKRAEAELRERLVRVERDAYARPAPITYAEWAEHWFEHGKTARAWKPRTIDKYRKVREHLEKHFEGMQLAEIRPRDVTEYVRSALETFSPRYVNLHVNVLHDQFKIAVVDEHVRSNPVIGVERPKVPRNRWRILEPREVPRVSKAFTDARARRVFLTLALTGLRRGELVALTWQHVNLVEGTLRVVESKSEEGERLVALPPTLVNELAEHFAGSRYRADTDYVFAHPTRGSKLEPHWYHQQFHAALTAAAVEGRVRTFHDMRHTALTNLAATGASPIAVMATAGHRSMATTRQYLHLAGVAFATEAAALESRLLGDRESVLVHVEVDDELEPSTRSSTRLSEPQPIEDDVTPLRTVSQA